MNCKQLRRQLITHGTFNPSTGERRIIGKEWKTQPCDVPLFSENEKHSGICKSCASGWSHPENFPVKEGRQ